MTSGGIAARVAAGMAALVLITGCKGKETSTPAGGVRAFAMGTPHTRDRAVDVTRKTKITITAFSSALEVDPAQPAQQIIPMAMFTNDGPNGNDGIPDAAFHMKKKSEATYYAVALPSLNTVHKATEWALLEVSNGHGSTPGTVTEVKRGWIHGCGHPDHPQIADADFYDCSHHAQPLAVNRASMLPFRWLPRAYGALLRMVSQDSTDSTGKGRGEDPPWATCNNGCCTLVN